MLGWSQWGHVRTAVAGANGGKWRGGEWRRAVSLRVSMSEYHEKTGREEADERPVPRDERCAKIEWNFHKMSRVSTHAT